MRIYVASSWRNTIQPSVVTRLRDEGYEVYDFRNPSNSPGDNGFHWSEIDENWRNWTVNQYRDNLNHPIAIKGFNKDFYGMGWAEVGILVMPCGRSAHLEAGYFVGAGKPLIILIPEKSEPELMYRMADCICTDIEELMVTLKSIIERRK